MTDQRPKKPMRFLWVALLSYLSAVALLVLFGYWQSWRHPEEVAEAGLLYPIGAGVLFFLAGVPVLLVYRSSRLQYVRAVERDADEARETARDLRIYKALLENTLDGVSVGRRSKKTGKRQLVWCNDAYVRASGYSRERILSEPHIPNLAESIWADDPVSEPPGDDDPDLVGMQRRCGECRWQRPDGRDNVIAWHAVIFDYGGEDEWVLTVDRDVTEQRRAAERLQESEQRYRMIVENAFDGISICRVDPDMRGRRLVFANDRFVEMSGYSREELTSVEDLNDLILFHARGMPAPLRDGMSRSTGVASWVRPDGQENYYEWQATLIEVDGECYSIGADRDITAERRIQNELARSEKLHRTIVDNAFEGLNVCVWDRKTHKRRLLSCNDRYVEMTGFTRDELFAMDDLGVVTDVHFASEREDVSGPDSDLGVEGVWRMHGVSSWQRPDGRENYFQWHATMLEYEDEIQIIGADRDITDERRTRRALEESEQRHRTIVENAFDGIDMCVEDKETHRRRLVQCNDRFVEMSGYSREELFASENLNALTTQLEPVEIETVKKGVSVMSGLGSWKRPDGKENWFEWQATRIDRGDHWVLFGADRDITERRLQEEALRRSEELYRTTVENTFDGINVFLIDKETGIRTLLSCNDRYVEMSGRTREELFNCDDLMAFQELVWESEHEEREPGVFVCHGVCSWKRPDGKENYFEWNACYCETPEGIRVIGADRDITERVLAERERRDLESKIQHTQKLESLGVLAGGIAHDFNNLLIGILGNADLAARDLPRTSTARNHVMHIETAAKRAADLCRQMLAYSGKGRFVVERLDLSEVVKEMGQLLSVSSSKHITIRYDLAEGLPAIEADATQLRQVAMNLITNAAEAIGERTGMISIATSTMDCDADYLKSTYLIDEIPAGRYVCFEVSDNGCGMDRDTVERIFEPFFSTKFTGRGLGMAAVLGIVRGHKGAIKVYSEPGRGTTFRILFPACEGEAASRTSDPVRSEHWTGKGVILLVDDEQIVRDVAKEMLKTMGFEVVCACDGVEAVEIFQKNPERFALVLLDMTMPRMGGEDTFRELRRIRSDLPVVMSSGYNEQDVVSKFTGKGLAGFVQKPYQTSVLRGILRDVLEETSSG